MDSSRPTLPQEERIWSPNADSLVRSEGLPPLPLPKEGPIWSFNSDSSVQRLLQSWGMDSSRPTLPKEGPTLSFNVDSSVGSEEPPPSWGMDCYRPTLPKGGSTTFIAGSTIRNEGLPPPPPYVAIENLNSQVETIPNSYSQVDSNWKEDSFTRLLLEHEDFRFDSSPWTNNMPNFQEPARDGSAAATVPIYNQNFPPRSEVGTSSDGTSSFQFSLATPNHMRQLDTHDHFDMFNWSAANQEKDRYPKLSVPAENVACNTSAATVSAEQLTERTILQKEGDWVVNLNKTPMQTTPRRHKHRPKVIIEGKPQRTPKAAEALKNENPPAIKRKYVRKNNLTQMEVGSTSKEQPSSKRKYVRKNGPPPNAKRLLNFDLRKDQTLNHEAINLSGQRYEVVNQDPLNVESNISDMPNLNQPCSINQRGLRKEKNIVNDSIETTSSMPIILYKGDGAIVPHERHNIRKKKSQNAKVDLDTETGLAWKLSLGSECNDEKREKWWEEERKLFQGRIESFTARMHLIQGDRRFSKWKGSVLDSVIGVFLTQNVSDHLSSSAFMSLVAKFPNSKESKVQTCFKGETNVLAESRLVQTTSSDLLTNVSVDSDEDLSWLLPKSKRETSRTCIPTTVLHAHQAKFFELQRPIDQYTPKKNGARVGKEFSWLEERNNLKLTSKGTFLGTTFSPGNKIVPTIPEKATRDFKLFADESNFFMDPRWSVVSYKGNGIHNQKPSMQQQKILNKEPSSNKKDKAFDWDSLRRQVECNTRRKHRCRDAFDSLDFDALRKADVEEISNAIKARGFSNLLARRMKAFLHQLMEEHGAMDLEWLRDAPQDKVKDYLLSIVGIGLKSTECVRLLTLHHPAFPVDTNVGRIVVRLGWVPLQPLPESLPLHLLKDYPEIESIQKYLWPRLCKLDQPTLYELHYQMITFGKVFCTKSQPNCNACPMRGECRHYASALASARLALPGPEERGRVISVVPTAVQMKQLLSASNSIPFKESGSIVRSSEPIVEEPASPEPERNEVTESDMEDALNEDSDDIPTIKLNLEESTQNLHSYMQENMELQGCDISKALVALTPEVASIPSAKLKNVSRLRTEHLVYELPDSHPLLEKLDRREQDDPSPYLLAIWTPGETACSTKLPERNCRSHNSSSLCTQSTCLSCNSIREADKQIVRGTLLVPCRTAMKGSFPLNGTYFQVNEMFADHESSINPISVPRSLLWNLPRKTVYFGTSVTSILKGMSLEEIQKCFWRGFVCVRGFDQKTRTPRPLIVRLHFPATKMVKAKK